MSRAEICFCFCAIVGVTFVGGCWYVFDSVSHVNEPRIRPEDHAAIRKNWPELVAPGAYRLQMLYRWMDDPLVVFSYRGGRKLSDVLAKVGPRWRVEFQSADYAEIRWASRYDLARGMLFGQIWRSQDRIVVALMQREDYRTLPDWQERIRAEAHL